MTLLDIINQSSVKDLSSIQVWVESNPAYDFKGDSNAIFLISQPLGDSLNIETLTLQEVVDFSKELDFSEEDIILVCEYEMEDLKSSEWHGNKLTLYF
jgi:hypothetical protein